MKFGNIVHLYVLFCTHIIYISKKFTSSKQNSTLLGHTSLSSKLAVNPSISQKYFGSLQPRPTTEESPVPPEMPFQVPPLLPSLPGPLIFPEQASSHRLSFAQQVLRPGCPFLPSPVKPSASFKSSSAPSIPASPQPPWAAMSLSPHRPLRKHHSPCLSGRDELPSSLRRPSLGCLPVLLRDPSHCYVVTNSLNYHFLQIQCVPRIVPPMIHRASPWSL